MKIYIYKLLITLAFIYVLFQLTIGLVIKDVKKNIMELKSEENIETIKNKIRDEIKVGLEKEKIFNNDDAKLIRRILNKINIEINNTK
ncbi:hypothetical protein OAP04_03210 [Pelagibacteraceae bacterium]|jgi:hypothetical protein|nr:hypothetical protein [Pelagibacteraceae bacterium]